ncbi:hypothetical protein GCM10011376_39590 [Nocardioides flavus (ex Wang et al. 2016)]|uniref:Hemerythrin HHE cation binding domain-containing protein n=1 Tax=Nocardioides flavus (ex Wang et al. 2016) TaxID=2058780 RepID=A0ABQ3HTW2_9ACTN|nr:DUF2249 domain-containing protein [Nocardioides flavus (ex Wang et al. 2016)]GHE19349.1 hypothetical protein GCM10011376_39590 [Nocardioides flavus (ex Wang et al. 2016)]
MSSVTIASSHADAEAAEKVEQHHAEMAGRLDLLTADVVRSARTDRAAGARRELLSWLRDELVPHATAEERTLYPAAAQIGETRLLVEAMLAEHVLIHRLVADLEAAADPVEAAAVARALETVFDSHLAKENDQLIPTLVASPSYSVAEMLEGMHELLGGADAHCAHAPQGEVAAAATQAGAHQCACGGHDEEGLPELDARAVPHAIRHATIFGALDGLRPGAGLLLTADHDPVPLLAQLEQRAPGAYAVTYRDAGPEVWRLELMRKV